MNTLKYFDTGISPDPRLPTYALYNHVTDCFVGITHDLEYIKKIKFLMSSRYMLWPCIISFADNFHPNLIDNSVCENWSLSNRHSVQWLGNNNLINFFSSGVPQSSNRTTYFECLPADSLCPSSPLLKNFNVAEEKQWFLLCLHWLNYLKFRKERFGIDIGQTMLFLDFDNDSPLFKKFIDVENKILKLLYLETEFETADNKIKELLLTYE